MGYVMNKYNHMFYVVNTLIYDEVKTIVTKSLNCKTKLSNC